MDSAATGSSGLTLISVPQDSSRAPDDFRHLLDRFRGLCKESGDGFSNALTRVTELQERLDEERFHLLPT